MSKIEDHGIFIAIRKLDAFDAVAPDLVGKFRFVNHVEAET